MNFSLAIDSNVVLAETPVWDPRIEKLYWTDTLAGDVHRYDPETGAQEVFKTGKPIGSAIPTSDVNVLLVSLEDGLHLLDLETEKLTFVADPENGNPLNRYNDTRVDGAGRVFMSSVSKLYGSPDYKPDMLGAFYMVDTDGSVKTVVEGISQYNAMVWNSDDTKMFVVDTFNEELLAFDYDIARGPVSGPVSVIDFKGRQGMPDGISIDAEDNLYVCHWSGTISVWNKNMEHVEDIRFPVEFACCGGFGGKDLRDFYVASSKYGYTEEELKKHPGAGGTFVGKSAVAGTLDHFYKIK